MVGLASMFIPHGRTQRVADDQTIWPAPEALNLATAMIRRGYMLPETTQWDQRRRNVPIAAYGWLTTRTVCGQGGGLRR